MVGDSLGHGQREPESFERLRRVALSREAIPHAGVGIGQVSQQCSEREGLPRMALQCDRRGTEQVKLDGDAYKVLQLRGELPEV